MQFYTLEEAAKALLKTPEWLLQQMVSPDIGDDKLPESFLTPSVYFEEPVMLVTRNTGNSLPGWFSGWFDVKGMEEVGKLRNGEICLDRVSRYLCLTREDERYLPYDRLKIHVSTLHIRKDELDLFARLTGRRILADPPFPIASPASEAAKILKTKQTADVDKIAGEINAKILALVKDASNNRDESRTINHIRFINEADIPENKRKAVMKKVTGEIKAKYGDMGFTSLSRRPKPDDPYLLP